MLTDVKIEIAKDVLSQRIDDETVLLNTTTGSYFGLSPVASRMWELLEQGRLPREIVTELEAEYDADASQIGDDVESLLKTLRERRLIVS